jgi:hypothetical protein
VAGLSGPGWGYPTCPASEAAYGAAICIGRTSAALVAWDWAFSTPKARPRAIPCAFQVNDPLRNRAPRGGRGGSSYPLSLRTVLGPWPLGTNNT